MASLITLCNMALAEIAKAQIASLDEGSLEARECKRFAEPLLAEIIDWSDDMALSRKREVLALTVNDRPAEWLYAYAVPNDLGAPIAIRGVEEAATALPLSGPFNFPLQDAAPIAFCHEAGRIYTNAEDATLIYSKATISAPDLSPLLQRAFVLELAARIAGPLVKDPKIVDQKLRQAEAARHRAVADEENKVPRQQARYISEAEYARHGIGV